jgi:cell division protease FtsH
MDKNKKNKKNKNFFEGNPLIVFVLFSLVTIMAFKNLFPQDGTNANFGQDSYGKNSYKKISYSDLKKLISNGSIEYVGIGDTSIKAISKPTNGTQTTYNTLRVIPDHTLIPMLEAQNIAYGGVNEQNLLADMIFGWVLPLLIFFGIWMFLAKRMSKTLGGGMGGMLGMGGASKMINSEKPKVKFKDMAGNI